MFPAAAPHPPRHRAARFAAMNAAFGGMLVVLFAVNLCIGSVGGSPEDIFLALFSGADSSTLSQVIWQIRLPRVITAILLGGALSLSGFLLQTFFNNPIADPFVLGISSGSRLTVALAMIVVLGSNRIMTPWMSVAAALAGALATTAFVLLLARKVRSQSTLIVAGVMVGYLCSAATNFLIAFADDQSIVNLQTWSQGSFSGASWHDVTIVCVCVLVMSGATFALSKPLGAYQLGESAAQGLGVNIMKLRIAIVLISSALSACVTAFAGPISFVGIAAPHLARRIVASSRPLLVIPTCLLTGSVFCCGCDLAARMLFSPVELPVSAVTAVVGAPIVIALMLKRRSLT